MRRKTWAVAALARVAVCAGCGGTRSSGGNDTAATPGTRISSTATARAKTVKFAECMRANGVDAAMHRCGQYASAAGVWGSK
jgi:hypothetical protein